MSVTEPMRDVERDIDERIRDLPLWRGAKHEVLADLMSAYRDMVELAHVKIFENEILGGAPEELEAAFGMEVRLRAGVLWALKWATEYCPSGSDAARADPETLVNVVFLGQLYETFVDALKMAQLGQLAIDLNEEMRSITFYEGGSLTPSDAQVIHRQRLIGPKTAHVSLTADDDQLTLRWSASDYRRVTRALADAAEHEEEAICIDSTVVGKLGIPNKSIPKPAVVKLKRPHDSPDCHVFDDLTLPPTMSANTKWKLLSQLDSPIVSAGDTYLALSSDLRAIASIDDHMLRLAVRLDPDQYSAASTLREGRMIALCRDALEHCPSKWHVSDRVLFKNPAQECDVLATRSGDSLAIQLKSTLRPEAPWEAYKRNEDIIAGLRHTKSLVDRGIARQGILVTDGYRGDYACWAEALATGIFIATLDDVRAIAEDPGTALPRIAAHAGVDASSNSTDDGLPDRECELLGWRLVFRDAIAP